MSSTTTLGVRNPQHLRVAAVGLVAAAAVLPILPNIPHAEFACPLRATTGIPCPMCGMTRACMAAVHGHLASSLAYNPAGVLLIVAAVVAIVRPQLLTRIRVPVWLVAVVAGALWVWNLGFNPTFHQWLWR